MMSDTSQTQQKGKSLFVQVELSLYHILQSNSFSRSSILLPSFVFAMNVLEIYQGTGHRFALLFALSAHFKQNSW